MPPMIKSAIDVFESWRKAVNNRWTIGEMFSNIFNHAPMEPRSITKVVEYFNRIKSEAEIQIFVPEIRKLLDSLDETQLKKLSIILCMQQSMTSTVMNDLRLKTIVALNHRQFYISSRIAACERFVEIIKDFSVLNKNDQHTLRLLAHWLGLLAFYCHQPTISDELDWCRLIDDASTAGTVNEIAFVVLQFLLVSFESPSVVFTSRCAWIRSIFQHLFDLAKGPKTVFSKDLLRVLHEEVKPLLIKAEVEVDFETTESTTEDWHFVPSSTYLTALDELPNVPSKPQSIWAHEMLEVQDHLEDLNSYVMVPDKQFLNRLTKFVWDMKALISSLPESVRNENALADFIELLDKINEHTSSLNGSVWEEILREIIYVYVCITDSRHVESKLDNLIARQCYRRIVHHILRIYSFRYAEMDLTTIVCSGIFRACQTRLVNLSVIKDLAESNYIGCQVLDNTFRDLFWRDVGLGNDTLLLNLNAFGESFEHLGLHVLLPLLGEILHLTKSVSDPMEIPDRNWLAQFRAMVEQVFYLFTLVPNGSEEARQFETFAIDRLNSLILKYNKFNLRHSVVYIATIAMRAAFVIFPSDTSAAEDVRSQVAISDAWAMMAGFVFNVCPASGAERADLLADLMNLMGNLLLEEVNNIALYRLFSRSILSFMRYIVTEDVNIIEKHAFFDLFLSFMFETQPIIHPTFCFHWLSILSEPFISNNMMVFPDDRLTKRYIHCLLTGFEFLQDIFESGQETPATDKFALGLRNTLMMLCTANVEFFARYHFYFLPMVPIYFQFIRHIFLIATEKPISRPILVTIRQHLKLPQSMMNPFCHTQSLPQCPGRIRELLRLVPMCSKYDEIADMLVQFFCRNKPSYAEYNNTRIYSFVIASIAAAVNHIRHRGQLIDLQTVRESGFVNLYLGLFQHLNTRGVWYILNAVVDQIRYPNSHTSFSMCFITIIFNNSADLKDLITSVLFRHLSVPGANRHGLLILASELAYSGGLLECNEMKEPIFQQFTARLKQLAEEAHKNKSDLIDE